MAEVLTPKWLIWRLDVTGDLDGVMKAGLKRYQEKFGAPANQAMVSIRMEATHVEKVRELLPFVGTSRYIFNQNEVFVGRVEECDGKASEV